MSKNENWTDPTKDYVGLELCFFCGEAKGVLLDRRMRNVLPREGVYNYDPCNKCGMEMQQGIMVIEIKDGEQEANPDNPYRTGRQWIIREEAMYKWFRPEVEKLRDQIMRQRFVLMEQHVCISMGMPPPEEVKE